MTKGISRPTPNLSKSDRNLLKLFEKILIEGMEKKTTNNNLKRDHVALSEEDALALEKLVNELLESRKFVEALHFVEAVTSPDESDEERAREIFLNARKHLGRPRIRAGTHWADFCHRLGVSYTRPSTSIRPMKVSYFRTMELKLFKGLGLDLNVIDRIVLHLEEQELEIENIRREHKALRRGLIKDAFTQPFISLAGKAKELREQQISSGRLIGAITILGNTSVLFTTRDWSVTGTLSTMAGAITAMVKE